MWIWLAAFPLGMFLILAAMATLESRLLNPLDRADRINKWLETMPADEVEEKVAALLASVVNTKPA